MITVIPDTLGYVRTYWTRGSTLDKKLTRYQVYTRTCTSTCAYTEKETTDCKAVQQLRTWYSLVSRQKTEESECMACYDLIPGASLVGLFGSVRLKAVYLCTWYVWNKL